MCESCNENVAVIEAPEPPPRLRILSDLANIENLQAFERRVEDAARLAAV